MTDRRAARQGPLWRLRLAASQRLGGWSFWLAQLGVVLLTAFHMAVEWTGVADRRLGTALGLGEIPIALYLVPVAFAGIVYGREGGVATGTLAALLATPTFFLWHRTDFAWLGELAYLFIVLGVGVAITVPVERERRERRRAQAHAHRLALLDEVASELGAAVAIDDALSAALERVLRVMALDRIGMRELGDVDAPIEVEIERLVGGARPPGRASGPTELPSRVQEPIELPLVAGTDVIGELTLVAHHELEPADRDLLAAVGAHLGIALEKHRAREVEQRSLRTYVNAVTRALEEERTRLARELHDDAAQALVALCRGLDELSSCADDPGSTRRALGGLRDVAAEILDGLRRFSRGLRPLVLDDLGLVPALEWLTRDFGERTDVVSRFSTQGEARRLPSDVELALFRVTQEALTNVEKHAGAADVAVAAVFEPARVVVSIADDGCGFSPDDPLDRLAERVQLGLIGMRERAALVGARLEIDSEPGRGTVVTVEVPVT